MTDWLDDRSKVEKAICGAIQSAIHSHGPITSTNKASAAKRVYGTLKQLRREKKDKNA